MTGAPLPVHVLTGFLGSGKTTLLNRLLTTEAGARTAVVVNELGDVGIDHLIVETSDDTLVELAGGCVCCTVRGDLAVTLADLLARRDRGAIPAFERIVIETTGLAAPAPVLNLLATDPVLAHRAREGAVVATVDAVNGDATLDAHPESVHQAALADTLVITKSDVLPGAVASLEARLGRLNPGARILHAVHGMLPSNAQPFGDERPGPRMPVGELAVAGHGDGIETFTLMREAPLPGAALALFAETLAEQLGADLLRIKGLVKLAESPGRPAVLHGAQHVLHPVDFLPRWPDADRRTRLVLVTRGDTRSWCDRLLDAIVWEVGEAASRLVPMTEEA